MHGKEFCYDESWSQNLYRTAENLLVGYGGKNVVCFVGKVMLSVAGEHLNVLAASLWQLKVLCRRNVLAFFSDCKTASKNRLCESKVCSSNTTSFVTLSYLVVRFPSQHVPASSPFHIYHISFEHRPPSPSSYSESSRKTRIFILHTDS